MIRKLAIVVLTVFVISCAKDESPLQKIEKNVSISSFTIEENIKSGVTTKTDLSIQGFNNFLLENHGLYLYRNGKMIRKVEQGELSENSFISNINSGIIKGTSYSVHPYILVEKQLIYGDTLDFISNVDIKIKVKEIKPLHGFVYDTITVVGENFCASTNDYPTRFILDNNFQNVISESDSLIKVVITPHLSKSKLTPTIQNCGVDTILQKTFKIDPPKLDSITSKETYAGENSFLYGENFHALISTIWVNDIETQLNKNRQDIDKLEFTIPEGLPSGLLNLKIKVLDTIIEKQDYYKSTSPVITSLDKRNTGFLDTLVIKGNYFKQAKMPPPKVLIGNRAQRIIEFSNQEIKIVIDNYFSDTSPKLVLKTGNFELEENINMLPPEILSFDKEKYHLDNDLVTLKTRYFIAGSSSNITMGGSRLKDYNSFVNVDEYGIITLPTKSWLEAGTLYPDFLFSDVGKLKVEIKTQFGSDDKPIGIFPPRISSQGNSSLLHNEYIRLNGVDFGYSRVNKIYIDDTPIENPHNSGYTVYNKSIEFQLPQNLIPGTHTLKVETGGQFSNEVSFNLKQITVSRLIRTSGARELDVFTIEGNNLENAYSYGINVNGVGCKRVSLSKNQVQYTIPYYKALENNMPVTITYGEQTIDVGFINGLEPYTYLGNKITPSEYYISSTHFEFQKSLYILTYKSILKFDETTLTWSTYEIDFPDDFSYNDSNGNNYISTIGNKIYIPTYKTFYVYDMILKQWETPINLNIGEKSSIIYGFVTPDNYAYIFLRNDAIELKNHFIKYNLTNHSIEDITQPPFLPNSSALGDEMYYHDGKIYMDIRDKNIMVYDTQSDTWEDIGFPKTNTFYYYNNLYVYNNTLYLSGGIGSSSKPNFNVYAYDLITKVWKEKNPMLLKLGRHAVLGKNGFLYFGLGFDLYIRVNTEMIKYDLSKESR